MIKCYDCEKEMEITPTTIIVKDYWNNVVGYECNKCFNKMKRSSRGKEDE